MNPSNRNVTLQEGSVLSVAVGTGPHDHVLYMNREVQSLADGPGGERGVGSSITLARLAGTLLGKSDLV